MTDDNSGYIEFSAIDGTWRDEDGEALGMRLDDEPSRVYIPQGKRCHETHPDLEIGGGVLLGGNCRDHARHSDVDLYVALDSSQQHPLFEEGKLPPRCVYYPIRNMDVPKKPEKFSALIDLIVDGLSKGMRIHVGCIGGHGRTGLVLAAVVARIQGPDCDAIGWVRANYCSKALETKGQENFVAVYFGCKLPPATKTPYQKGMSQVDKRRRGL